MSGESSQKRSKGFAGMQAVRGDHTTSPFPHGKKSSEAAYRRLRECSLDLFWRHGYDNTSTADLQRHSGVGAPVIYRKHHSKQDLYLTVLADYQSVRKKALRDAVDTPDPVEAVRSLVIDWAVGPDGEGGRGCFTVNATIERSSRDAATGALVRRFWRDVEETLIDLLGRAQIEGRLNSRADVVTTARFILAAMQGIALMGRSGMDGETARAAAHNCVKLVFTDA